MLFNIDPEDHFCWSEIELEGWRIQFAPKSYDINLVFKFLKEYEVNLNLDKLADSINTLNNGFGFIAKKNDLILACVDRIRSYPIFYSEKKNIKISGDVNRFIDKNLELETDPKKIIEFAMIGYLTNDKTFLSDVKQLESAEILQYPNLKIKKYFHFLPDKILDNDENDYIKKLEFQINNIFKSLIEKNSEKNFIVPLSGGLDSRLVIGKLVELGCKNLTAVSYGPKKNYEAKIAKEVAKILGVKWIFVESKKSLAKKYFNSKERLEYWKMASGMCSSPNMQEFEFLCEMKRQKILKKNSIIVNGQTGDFITGAHIPQVLFNENADLNLLEDQIIKKHFSLWKNLINKESNLILAKQLINSQIKNIKKYHLGYIFNYWEWSERQSKYVVNQQRTYDYFNLSWNLPLWEKDFMIFWKNIPIEYLKNGYLYKTYLKKWNYKNLFQNEKLNREIYRWPGNLKMVIGFAKIIEFIFGKKIKNLFYEYMKYFGHYSNHYGSFSFFHFLKRARNIRHHQSLYVETWLKENFPRLSDKIF